MPEGGTLFVYTTDGSSELRGFTAADNEAHGQLWTPPLNSDDIIVEVTLPSDVLDHLELELTRVNHGYRGFDKAMGDKSAAKALMKAAGVPVVPGYHGDAQDDAALAEAAEEVGFPVLIKPAAGGGGKGLRVVASAAEFAEALAASRREANSAFGDDKVLLERYLERPRHVEVQVFGDGHGNVVHLFERDCSIQRRHQKIVEEAPALDADSRRAIGEAAVAAARAVAYVGAGTVEFLLGADGAFWFIEMNTRLQVEHPVTEMITGQDLVEWQLRVAAGEALPCAQDALAIDGHAIEARIYAEDPGNDFLPSAGRLDHLRFPAEDDGVRVDTGVRQGDSVGVHYDPMIAKLIVWGKDRAAAVARLGAALGGVQVAGVATNVAFLAAVAAHSAFAAGAVDTGFVERHRAEIMPAPGPAPDRALALACLDALLRRAEDASARESRDPHSPWGLFTGWRLTDEARHALRFLDGDAERVVMVRFTAGGYRLDLPGGAVAARGERNDAGDLVAEIGGERVTATVVERGREVTVFADGASHRLFHHDPLDSVGEEAGPDNRLIAPMPGKVVAVKVEPGARVSRGAPLMVIEAMKMEHTIAAPADGCVERVNYAPGDRVEEGAELIAFSTDGA
ncbi:MAG: ATP-grasp domain-containing protein [Proteobacteria bacterium]|nr:ATP-grasp domain-containing protein [Pseudomonadota bacterium]